MITKIIVEQNPTPDKILIRVVLGTYYSNEFVVLKVEQSFFFPNYDAASGCYTYELDLNHPFLSPYAPMIIRAMLYDYNHETFTDVRQGDFMQYDFLPDLTSISLSLVPGAETTPTIWRAPGCLVSTIEGPFQDDKLVTELDLSKKAYYLATPNDQNITDSQLLSIRWEYQYNSETNSTFKYSTRTIETIEGVRKCKIECGFHNKDSIHDVTLYPFFNERSSTLFKKCSTTHGKINPGTLIWSAKVTAEFEEKVIQICSELWGEDRKIEMANGLMAVMAVETAKTFKAHIIEGQTEKTLIPPALITKDDFKKGETSSKPVGLIQFTQDALVALKDFKNGSGYDKLHEVKLMYARMGEIKQLDKVKQYFYSSRDKIKTAEDIYLKVFAPAGIGESGSFVLYESPSDDYKRNMSIDTVDGNNNKKIERRELLSRYYKLYEDGKKYIRKEGNAGLGQTSSSETSSNSEGWHDPVDNPMLCLYTQNGNYRPRYNVFGKVRIERSPKTSHQGLDLLALPGSNVYACVDCTLEYISIQEGYGNVICLKVKDPKTFLEHKRDFKLTYESEGEALKGDGFTFDGDLYLFYAHLKSVKITTKDKEIPMGKVIALNGTTGYGTSRDPHLHFEIRNKSYASKGLANRCHPGYFVPYKDVATMTEEEKNYHKKIAEKNWD